MGILSSETISHLAAQPVTGADPCAVIKEETIRVCEKYFGTTLRAVILTGSLSRNEGSFRRSENGWQLLGDAEFIVVLCDSASIPDADQRSGLNDAIKLACVKRGVSGSISLAVAHPNFLSDLKPSIFAYELRECGACLTGDREILKLIPVFDASEIPLEDGWRMLSNRMVEQLESMAAVDLQSPAVTAELAYRTVKLYLDMATSMLLFAGAYEPTYKGRVQRLRNLRSDRAIGANLDMTGFVERVAECTEWKLSPTNALSVDRQLWQASLNHAVSLMTWELSQLTGNQAKTGQLAIDWAKREPLSSRIRGWAFVVRASGWIRSWKQWPRWGKLFFQGSPRRLTYAAAIELYNQLPCLMDASQADRSAQESAINKLPVVTINCESCDWRAAVQMCAWNYRQFLENTRS